MTSNPVANDSNSILSPIIPQNVIDDWNEIMSYSGDEDTFDYTLFALWDICMQGGDPSKYDLKNSVALLLANLQKMSSDAQSDGWTTLVNELGPLIAVVQQTQSYIDAGNWQGALNVINSSAVLDMLNEIYALLGIQPPERPDFLEKSLDKF